MSSDRFWGFLMLFVLAGDAEAGVIRGRVTLPRAPQGEQAVGTKIEVGGPEEAVVWVDSLPDNALRRYRGRWRDAQVVQGQRRFSPRVIAVATGTTVRFVNRDRVYHNVFSVSPAKRFDLGKYPPRAVNQVTFTRPGLVNLYCDIHPGMAAYLVVFPHRVFARPNRAGDFVLPDLPPGVYTVCVWHPTYGELRHRVEVPWRRQERLVMGY